MNIDDVQIVLPKGMLGPDKDYLVDGMLRAIAEHHAAPNEWADKYGTDVDTPVFMMHRYCWCDGPDCPWCWDESEKGEGAPNFHYKPTDFKVWWYKYIGRGMRFNRPVSIPECARIRSDCLAQPTPGNPR